MKRSKLITATVISAAVAILLFVGGALAWYFLTQKKSGQPCPEGGHEYGSWLITQRPSCGEPGKEIANCKKCGAAGEREVPATGNHNYTGWSVQKLATFTENGERTRKCTQCKAAEETEVLPALGSGGTLALAGEVASLPLGSYHIIYSDKCSSEAGLELQEQAAAHLCATIKAATGVAPAVGTQYAASSSPKILIGDTGYPESERALAALAGEGFSVCVSGETVVIVGSNEVHTAAGVAYLAREFLSKRAEDGLLRVPTSLTKLYTGGDATLMTSSGTQFEVVFDKNLDNDPAHAYVANWSDTRDYPCVAAESLAAHLEGLLGSSRGSVTWRDDSTEGIFELIVGTADRLEVKGLLPLLDGNEYAILVRESRVILAAHNDYALARCIEKFQALLAASKEEAASSDVWRLPVGFCYISTGDEDWVTDFPRPAGEGIAMHSSMFVNYDALQYLYTGIGVNYGAFLDYRSALLGAGYMLVTEHNVEGSYFFTAKSVLKNVMIHVAFDAFSHASEPHNIDDATHRTEYPYLEYAPCLRIVVAPLDGAYLPDEALFYPQAYTKVTQSSITTVNGGVTCYVILLEDGSFLVIDGGANTVEAKENLWGTLSALYQSVWGVEPSAANPVHIRAWYLTHSHGDHYGAFYNLLAERRGIGDIEVEYFFANVPDKSAVTVTDDIPWASNNLANIEEFGLRYQRVWTGQVFYFVNVKIEVLMTYADHAPRRIDNTNDTNTVTRLTFNEDVNGVVAKNLLVLGDSCLYQSRYLCAMYGAYLKSDMVQLAHHGNIGCEIALYQITAPAVIWYPHGSGAYNKYASKPGSNVWAYSVTDYVVRKLSSVQYIYLSYCDKVAGTQATTLVFKADGNMDHENIYNPITGVKYTYVTNSVYTTKTPAIKLR